MSLGQKLQVLEAAELIRLASAAELAYLFRHAMVQEAAYGSLVRADRKRLHLAAGDALEAVYLSEGQAAPPELAALLAQHFHNAGDARAQRYATLAGEAAMAHYANAEAISYFAMALEWAVRAPDAQPLSVLYARRGRALELNGQFTEALQNYRELGEQAAARGDQALKLLALVREGTLRANINPLFNPPEARRLAEEALPLAQSLGDQASEAKIHWNMLNTNRFTGNFRAARVSGEQSLALARAAGLAEQEAATLNDLIHVYGTLGAWPEHRAAAAGATERWRTLGNIPMLADSLATTGMYASQRGEYAQALAAAAEARQLARSINNLWGQAYSLSGVGMARWYHGEYVAAVQAARECLALSDPSGFLAAKGLMGVQLAGMLTDLGQTEAALVEAHKAAEFAAKHLPPLRPQALGVMAFIQISLGQLDEAEATLSSAPLSSVPEFRWMNAQLLRAHTELAVARRAPDALSLAQHRMQLVTDYQMLPLIVEAGLTLARAQRQGGQPAEARATLLAAQATAESIDMRRLLWVVLAELAGLALEAGDATEADRLRAQAQAILDQIAAGLPDPTMRATFERWSAQSLTERSHALAR